MTTCHSCKRSLVEAPFLVWDGNRYCRACITLHCKEAKEYAAKRPSFVAITTRDGVSGGRAWRRLVGFACIFMSTLFGLIFGIAAAFSDRFSAADAAVSLGIVVGLGTSAIAVFSIPAVLTAKYTWFPAKIAIEGGLVTISTPMETRQGHLAQCSWREAGAMRHPMCLFLAGPRGIVTLAFDRAGSVAYVLGCDDAKMVRAILEGAKE